MLVRFASGAHRGQASHSSKAERALSFDHVPAPHGTGEAVPIGQYPPAVHERHSVCPVCGWKLPAGHASQSACRGSGPLVPSGQGVAWVLRAGHAVPAGQTVHSLSCRSIGCAPKVPVGQSCGAELPARQKVPLGHGSGMTVAVPHLAGLCKERHLEGLQGYARYKDVQIERIAWRTSNPARTGQSNAGRTAPQARPSRRSRQARTHRGRRRR